MKNLTMYSRNMNGSITGIARIAEEPDLSVRVSWRFGSPFAGDICDDMDGGTKEFDDIAAAKTWLARINFRPENGATNERDE